MERLVCNFYLSVAARKIEICPWDTLTCCWDVKQHTNKCCCAVVLLGISYDTVQELSLAISFCWAVVWQVKQGTVQGYVWVYCYDVDLHEVRQGTAQGLALVHCYTVALHDVWQGSVQGLALLCLVYCYKCYNNVKFKRAGHITQMTDNRWTIRNKMTDKGCKKDYKICGKMTLWGNRNGMGKDMKRTKKVVGFLLRAAWSSGRAQLRFFCFCFFFLRSPAISLGFTTFGWEFCVCDRFFNPTIKVVTFRLRGWCVLGVFLLPAFTRLGHERQDLLSPCDEMHICTD